MGWREDLALELLGVISDLQHNPRADHVIMETLNRVYSELRADMPTPDCIALARELLAGTGRVVARDVGEDARLIKPEYARGWNACRAAMLAEDDAP